MVEITVKMPEPVAVQLGETPEARSRRVLENTAIVEYAAGRISQRQVGEILDMDYWQTDEFLRARGVPLNYSLADLEADRTTLNDVLRRP